MPVKFQSDEIIITPKLRQRKCNQPLKCYMQHQLTNGIFDETRAHDQIFLKYKRNIWFQASNISHCADIWNEYLISRGSYITTMSKERLMCRQIKETCVFPCDFFAIIPRASIHSLRWRHNGHDSVSNHQPHDCILNRLFGRRSKKTWKLRVTGLCVANSPGTGEFPAQMASNAENVSIWWRHHD